MHEPPSPELVRLLTELQLCHPNDLRRARGRVRRLSFDLPAFDSVWIDSLVQLRLLTPYQARMLEQGNAEQLRVGSFVVVDELGRGPGGTTYLVQPLNRRDRRVLKRHRVNPDRVHDLRRQLSMVLECAQGFAHPHIVVPSELLPSDEGELITASRYVPGLPLNELLVRRGRFPAFVVFEIGRQLLDGLSSLHAKSLVHGDIRLSNVRLTENGLAVLVDGGIRRVVHPEITIHDRMAIEAYDGIAPELIGTGEPPTASSELYAVGCLLWQLLAGRPPFPTADPLTKLASHQTLTIEDVRTWAPDTPEMLAIAIQQMTSPSPDRRPRTFDEILQRWGKPSSFGRARLKQFRRLFEVNVPHFSRPETPERMSGSIWIAGLLFALTGVGALLFDAGMRNELLVIAHRVKASARALVKHSRDGANNVANGSQSSTAKSSSTQRGMLPLPRIPTDGVILLRESGPYEAGSISVNGDLTIRAAPGVKPEIRIDKTPLRLVGASVTLEGITVRRVSDAEPEGLVNIRSQSLQILNCEFLRLPNDGGVIDKARQTTLGMASVFWSPSVLRGVLPGSLTVKNSVFLGTDSAISLLKTPKSLRILNTVKCGKGALVAESHRCLATDMSLELDHVTLRHAGPMLELNGEHANKSGAAPVRVVANNSVFQLADNNLGLIIVTSDQPRMDVSKSVDVKANNSVIAPDTALLKMYDPSRNLYSDDQTYDFDDQFEGLQVGEIKFSGNERSDLYRAAAARTMRIDGPRGTDGLPGIDLRQLGPANRSIDAGE